MRKFAINRNFPQFYIHAYWFLLTLTVSYLYYQRFINGADFYSTESTGGIYPVLEFESVRPIQFRLLIPFIFAAIKFILPISDQAIFFIITIVFCYLIVIAFYYLLNEYFENKNVNMWLAPVIMYPIIWNLIIMNGQFFYMDFSALFLFVLGLYLIVSERFNWLIAVFIAGIINHPSAGYLIPSFLLYRYREIFKIRTWMYVIILSALYIVYYAAMERIFADKPGYFVINNISRNLDILKIVPLHIFIRDVLMNFGGLHFALLIFLISGRWKKYISPLLMINAVIFPYLFSVLYSFSIEEMRNYSTIIPFVVILTLIYLSTFPDSVLKPVKRLFNDECCGFTKFSEGYINDERKRILYVSSKGGIHDHRFLMKMMNDYNVLLLFYSGNKLMKEIMETDSLSIIQRKPVLRGFPLFSEYFHYKRIYREFKPDVVHTGYVWQAGALAAFAGSKPHLSMPWGSDILIEPGKSAFKKRIVKKVMNQCDHVQCDANIVKKKIMEEYGKDEKLITVFPWGIDLSLFKPEDKKEARKKLNIAEDKFVIIYTRALEPVYDTATMTEAFRKFAKEKEDVLLLVTADGSQRKILEELLNDKDVSDKIKFYGAIPNKELSVYYNAANVYLSVSLSDGTSLSLLEAMATALGLVMTDIHANREWVNETNGFLVPVKEPGMIKEALEKYYSDRDLIKKHGDENLKIAQERADWDKNYQQLRSIYEKLFHIVNV